MYILHKNRKSCQEEALTTGCGRKYNGAIHWKKRNIQIREETIMAQMTPMMQQYVKTKEEYRDCILFYRLGDFYEMFFEDAQIGRASCRERV